MALQVGLLILVCVFASGARADEPKKLHFDNKLHIPIAVTTATVWLTAQALLPLTAPRQCRWCGTNDFDTSVRRGLLWDHPERANKLSNWAVAAIVPLASLGGLLGGAALDGNLKDSWKDVLVVTEAVSIAGLINQASKLIAARQRPHVHFDAYAGRHKHQDNVSFYSDHTSFAFSLVVSAGTVASMRGYRLAPVIWSVGVPAALLAGTMRIAADRHYFTDVLTGALIGSAVGALVPYLMHRPRHSEQPTIAISGNTMTLLFSF